jgi:hypothetical protein
MLAREDKTDLGATRSLPARKKTCRTMCVNPSVSITRAGKLPTRKAVQCQNENSEVRGCAVRWVNRVPLVAGSSVCPKVTKAEVLGDDNRYTMFQHPANKQVHMANKQVHMANKQSKQPVCKFDSASSVAVCDSGLGAGEAKCGCNRIAQYVFVQKENYNTSKPQQCSKKFDEHSPIAIKLRTCKPCVGYATAWMKKCGKFSRMQRVPTNLNPTLPPVPKGFSPVGATKTIKEFKKNGKCTFTASIRVAMCTEGSEMYIPYRKSRDSSYATQAGACGCNGQRMVIQAKSHLVATTRVDAENCAGEFERWSGDIMNHLSGARGDHQRGKHGCPEVLKKSARALLADVAVYQFKHPSRELHARCIGWMKKPASTSRLVVVGQVDALNAGLLQAKLRQVNELTEKMKKKSPLPSKPVVVSPSPPAVSPKERMEKVKKVIKLRLEPYVRTHRALEREFAKKKARPWKVFQKSRNADAAKRNAALDEKQMSKSWPSPPKSNDLQ